MQRKKVLSIAASSIALAVMFGATCHAAAQDAKAKYPSMAPLDQYLMEDRNSEITLARSAAPESISRDAEVMVLGRHGYETGFKEQTVSCAWWSARGLLRSMTPGFGIRRGVRPSALMPRPHAPTCPARLRRRT